MGSPVGPLVAAKVPLGAHFDAVIPPDKRMNVESLADLAAAARPSPLALVVDLTRSQRYYDPNRWRELGVQYVKVPCRGRGQVPEPSAVNDFCWEVSSFLKLAAAGGRGGESAPTVLVHCTHGFNRTGFMIVSYLVRYGGLLVRQALRQFAQARPPGIYKPYYVQALFRYYHEVVPKDFPQPSQPAWKGPASPDVPEEECDPALEPPAQHDDVMGEEVGVAEAAYVVAGVLDCVLGAGASQGRRWFPGSQPVSLARSNLELLRSHRYWVTWKADGTRYMILVLQEGTYLVDRKLAVRRVQLRWPMPPSSSGKPAKLQHLTLLDGEMIVDEEMDTGRRQRRFLAYDLMHVAGHSLVKLPWKKRYDILQRDVVGPRQREGGAIGAGQLALPYRYDQEPFRVRRKEFWTLGQSRTLLHRFIPAVSHESDGLIFQDHDEPYESGTCNTLLKWKFASLNSVDFRLRFDPSRDAEPRLELLETRVGAPRARGYHALEGARIRLPEGADPASFHHAIVECVYDGEEQTWVYLRDRRDKQTPNAYHVYESVQASIQDNILEDELLEHVDEAFRESIYAGDRALAEGRPAGREASEGSSRREGKNERQNETQQQQQETQHHHETQPPAPSPPRPALAAPHIELKVPALAGYERQVSESEEEDLCDDLP
ncbi:mRNA capping enzyme [Helicosporidium sp. ATCC 50920]|nr:mRNA capping enzyme [Helicosporidium sp. ATCC 50920]|eukprot:KDD75262.1 mRNA capping enzyme [Helicosporidium sp. ATCC 50920]